MVVTAWKFQILRYGSKMTTRKITECFRNESPMTFGIEGVCFSWGQIYPTTSPYLVENVKSELWKGSHVIRWYVTAQRKDSSFSYGVKMDLFVW